ncbi:MAG: T9SS type A sorting domain-containing protein, partial [Saprospiraceae bacterium]
KNATNAAPMPCESFDFGQIEDYCVLLVVPVSVTETVATREGKLKIFPQPAHTAVTLEWPEAVGETAQLQVWNLAGWLLLSQSIEGTQHDVQISVNDWPSGSYLVSLQTERGIWQEKLIKI